MLRAPDRLAIVIAGILLAGAAARLSAAAERENLGRGVAREGNRLIVTDAAGEVTVNLDGARPLPNPPAGLLVLRREGAGGGQFQVLDRRGRPLGTIDVPLGWTGFASEAGVILVPEALHVAERLHWLKFFSRNGELRREVREAEPMLVDWRVAPGGGVATVSRAPGDGTSWVILAYDREGTEIWRQQATGVERPDALLSSGGQLVVLERDPDGGGSTVTIHARGRAPKSHRLWSISRMVADPDSARVAAVGKETVALFDARTRKLVWRRDEPSDFVLYGGLRFDRGAARLLVIVAERDRPAGKARLRLRSYRLSDGADDREDLGEVPMDALPTVVDVETPPEGGRRVVLHDRKVTPTPEAPQP